MLQTASEKSTKQLSHDKEQEFGVKLLKRSAKPVDLTEGNCNTFLVWLRNRLISAGFQSVLSHTENNVYLLTIVNFPRIFK